MEHSNKKRCALKCSRFILSTLLKSNTQLVKNDFLEVLLVFPVWTKMEDEQKFYYKVANVKFDDDDRKKSKKSTLGRKKTL